MLQSILAPYTDFAHGLYLYAHSIVYCRKLRRESGAWICSWIVFIPDFCLLYHDIANHCFCQWYLFIYEIFFYRNTTLIFALLHFLWILGSFEGIVPPYTFPRSADAHRHWSGAVHCRVFHSVQVYLTSISTRSVAGNSAAGGYPISRRVFLAPGGSPHPANPPAWSSSFRTGIYTFSAEFNDMAIYRIIYR